jgi:hypothetical protein
MDDGLSQSLKRGTRAGRHWHTHHDCFVLIHNSAVPKLALDVFPTIA